MSDYPPLTDEEIQRTHGCSREEYLRRLNAQRFELAKRIRQATVQPQKSRIGAAAKNVERRGTPNSGSADSGGPELHIWTDGSHIKDTSKMGYGVYAELRFGGGRTTRGELSRAVDPASDHFRRVIDPQMPVGVPFSNPTLELAAAFVALKIAREHAGRLKRIVLYADYIGVIEYGRNAWKSQSASRKTAGFRNMAIHYQSLINDTRRIVPVEVVHVRGHSGNYGNDQADRLAKSGRDSNTFQSMLDTLY